MLTAQSQPTVFTGLRGKRVLVTGAGSGIGKAFCDVFARHGCRLVLNDLRPDLLDRLADELAASGTAHTTFAGSIADPAVVAGTFNAADTAFGGVDILVNNAGVSANKPTLDLSLEEWNRALQINLTSLFLCSTEAARRMQDGGTILNMASMYGLVAAPERLAYCATKSGVVMMTRSLACEWAGLGIRVNALAPGYVETSLVTDLLESGRLDRESIIRRTPQQRLGTPAEIAEAGAFLCSDAAAHITGHVLSVDGGWTAYGYL